MTNRTEIKSSNIEVNDSRNVNFGSISKNPKEKSGEKFDLYRLLLQVWQDAPWYTKLGAFSGVLMICITIIVWKFG